MKPCEYCGIATISLNNPVPSCACGRLRKRDPLERLVEDVVSSPIPTRLDDVLDNATGKPRDGWTELHGVSG